MAKSCAVPGCKYPLLNNHQRQQKIVQGRAKPKRAPIFFFKRPTSPKKVHTSTKKRPRANTLPQ